MRRLLAAATISVLVTSIVAIAAEPPIATAPAPNQPQPGPSQGLYRHEGNNTTLIPLATDAKVSYPFLKGPGPGVTFAGQSVAQIAASKATVGDDVVLEMSGELAQEYCRLSGTMITDKKGLLLQVSAAVLARTKDGSIVIEHEGAFGSKGNVLVYGIIAEDKFVVTTIPVGTPEYSSPRDKQPKLTTKETKNRTLKLSTTEGLTLRTLDAKK